MTEPFRTVLLDYPWPETGGGGRGAQNHYPVASVKDGPALILGSGEWEPAADAHCYLWATNSHLPDGLWLMDVLGFRYITAITWAKRRIGLGQYFRGRTEHLLFGVRGAGLALRRRHTARRDLSTLLEDDPLEFGRPRHSQKPIGSYELIEAASPGPYLEFFARAARPGWRVWGNQAPEPVEAPKAALGQLPGLRGGAA